MKALVHSLCLGAALAAVIALPACGPVSPGARASHAAESAGSKPVPTGPVLHLVVETLCQRYEGVPTPPGVLPSTSRTEYWAEPKAGWLRYDSNGRVDTNPADSSHALVRDGVSTTIEGGRVWQTTGTDGDPEFHMRFPAVAGSSAVRDYRAAEASGLAKVVIATETIEGTACVRLRAWQGGTSEAPDLEILADVRQSDRLPVRVVDTRYMQTAQGRSVAMRWTRRYLTTEWVPWDLAKAHFDLPLPQGAGIQADLELTPAEARETTAVRTYWLGERSGDLTAASTFHFLARPDATLSRGGSLGFLGNPGSPDEMRPRISRTEMQMIYRAPGKNSGFIGGGWYPQVEVVSMPRVDPSQWQALAGSSGATLTVGGREALWAKGASMNGIPIRALVVDRPDATVMLVAYQVPDDQVLRAAEALQPLR